MERRDFLKVASMGAAAAMMPSAVQGAESQQSARAGKPNIIFIVSDQHRAGLTKREGYPLDTSPTLDRLAESGVGFDRAYCTYPVCMPSRTSMLTGRWPEATHVRTNFEAEYAYYSEHLYQVAKAQGYRTGLAGKNHTFLKEGDLDFWRTYSWPHGWLPPNPPKAWVEFNHYISSTNANVQLKPTPFPLEVQFPYRIVSDAMDFIESSKDQPFILQVGFVQPHDPEQVSHPYWNMFPPESVPPRCAGPEALKQLGYRAQWEYGHQESGSRTEEHWRRYKSNYLGMLRFVDDQIGRLVDFLEKKNLRSNTVIVFLADHGDYLMDYGLARKGVGLPECLTRIPMIWSGARIHHTAVGSSAHVSMADVMPTLCEVMGAPIPHGVQGRSLWPLLQGKSYPKEEFRSIYSTVGLGGLYYTAADNVPFVIPTHRRKELEAHSQPHEFGFDECNKVTQSGTQKMVRMGDWKLIYDMMGYGQLYHLPSDPCELKNLFGHPSAAAEQAKLMSELCMWVIRTQDSLPTGPQSVKYQTKWSSEHNWYAPYRQGDAPEAFIP